VVLWLRH